MSKVNTFVKIIICSLLLSSTIGLQSCKSENKAKTEQQAKKGNQKNGNKNKGKKKKATVKNISAVQFASLIKNPNVAILDVRTDAEVKNGKIPGAKVLDFKAEDFKQQVRKLNKNKQYFVYCRSGVRSANAARIMVNNGFKDVYNLKGGYEAWKKNKAGANKKAKK